MGFEPLTDLIFTLMLYGTELGRNLLGRRWSELCLFHVPLHDVIIGLDINRAWLIWSALNTQRLRLSLIVLVVVYFHTNSLTAWLIHSWCAMKQISTLVPLPWTEDYSQWTQCSWLLCPLRQLVILDDTKISPNTWDRMISGKTLPNISKCGKCPWYKFCQIICTNNPKINV